MESIFCGRNGGGSKTLYYAGLDVVAPRWFYKAPYRPGEIFLVRRRTLPLVPKRE
jgi:hypothetical protein